MDILKLLTDAGAPLSIAIVALLMLREEGRRNAEALRTILREHIEATRNLAHELGTLAELIRADHPQED